MASNAYAIPPPIPTRFPAAMKRGYTTLEYKSKIRRLRKARPDICISSDFIVGFPGETREEFEATMDLIHDIGFDLSFSFIYSPRPGTPAAQLPDDVTMEEKKQRLAILQARINQQGRQISQNMVGSLQTVLVSRHAAKNPAHLAGRTENNRVVTFEGESTLIGQLVTLRIIAAHANTLIGERIC